MKTIADLNGMYIGYFTGSADHGVGMFMFFNGDLAGGDLAGGQFDGNISDQSEDYFLVRSEVKLPPGGTTVQGTQTGPDGIKYNIEFRLPKDFLNIDFIPIETPLGLINCRFEKVRHISPDYGHRHD